MRRMKESMAGSTRPGGSKSADETSVRIYDSRELFRGEQEVLIVHAGHAYRLRITRQDKLILTK